MLKWEIPVGSELYTINIELDIPNLHIIRYTCSHTNQFIFFHLSGL